jgi:hypothetical protein
MSKAEDTRFEIALAFRELATAHTETLNAIDRWEASGAPARALDEMLAAESLPRVELARRSLAAVLERHRWQPHKASAGAIGSSRPLNGGRRRRAVPSPRRRRRQPRRGAAA